MARAGILRPYFLAIWTLRNVVKAALIREYGGPDSVRIEELPDPSPLPGQVVLRIRAAGFNNSDLQTTNGGYGRPALPHVLGQEAAGEVIALGDGVDSLKVGDRVVGHVRAAFAEQGVANANELVTIPEEVSYEAAASLPIAYLTAAMALVQKAGTRAGETVFIHPASGGVGTAAIQLAKLLGTTVIATTGNAAKAGVLRDLGADHVLVYPETDLNAEVLRLTDGKGVNVALDGGGQATFPVCLEAIGMHGRVVIYGTMTGTKAELSIRKMLTFQGSVYGIAIWTNEEYQDSLKTFGDVVLPAVADGRLRVHIDRVVPLAGVPEALKLLAERRVEGKLVVAP